MSALLARARLARSLPRRRHWRFRLRVRTPPLARSKPRFGPPISIEEEGKTGAIAYWQGEYCQSRADQNGVSLLDYVHAIFGLLRQKQAQTALMIGCAGGSLATMLSRVGCDVVAIDVNPQAFILARRYFGLPAQVECRVADGFDYLLATRRKFDAIIVDAFHGEVKRYQRTMGVGCVRIEPERVFEAANRFQVTAIAFADQPERI